MENLRAAIAQDCPTTKSVQQNPREIEKEKQMSYVQTRAATYVKKDSLFRDISNYAFSDSPTNFPLVVVGLSGTGKTSLFANWYLDNKSPKLF